MFRYTYAIKLFSDFCCRISSIVWSRIGPNRDPLRINWRDKLMLRRLDRELERVDTAYLYEIYHDFSPANRRVCDQAIIRKMIPSAVVTMLVACFFTALITALTVLTNNHDPQIVRLGLIRLVIMLCMIELIIFMPWIKLGLFRRRVRRHIQKSFHESLEAYEMTH